MAGKLSTLVKRLKGIGPTKGAELERMHVKTLYDVLFDFPFRYDDLSDVMVIAAAQPGKKVTIQGTISAIENRRSKKNPRMVVTEAIVEDGSGRIKAVWFHQGFLTKTLKVGKNVSLSGKIDDTYGISLVNPVYEITGDQAVTKHTGQIVPIYKLTGSLTQKFRRGLAEKAIDAAEGELHEWIPEEIIARERFLNPYEAVKYIHFPNSKESEEKALRRFKYEEFLLHQLLHGQARREIKAEKAPVIRFNEALMKETVKRLPFALTGAQKKAVWAIIKDMEREEPMNRLLEGDVGTGKTIVGALVAHHVAAAGYQTAMLAPTEILAEQHARGLEKTFGDIMSIGLFTRTKRRINGREVTKSQMLEALRNGKVELVVGTHALLSNDVLFDRLGFIIVDEQHRFGVSQRKALKDREGSRDGIPHLLSMTATPIPRSLALVIYGDLDRSILDEYPAGRKTIDTYLISERSQARAYEHMREEMRAGHQVFVVCPLIEENDALGTQSVEEVYKTFRQEHFDEFNIAMLHGRLKTKEKDHVMSKFAAGEIDMVISTTVVEVGVDIPNATIMYIEGAERFGLAQLHQLRGRVGRSDLQSYCYLKASGTLGPVARERLEALTRLHNGFELADIDLKLRGPGNIFGTEQSGFEQFKLGSFADMDLISMARQDAKELLDEDWKLGHKPALQARLKDYVMEVHFE